MYHKIVVPLDGTKESESVLPYVQTLAESCEATDVILVRVVEPVMPMAGDFALPLAQTSAINRENASEADKYLDDVLHRVDLPGAHTETKVLAGSPARAIAEFAKQENADVIAVATHGRSGVSRWLLGSVADDILHAASIPVLVVRAPH